ncbi:hypothetical protein L3A27_01600, partial [Streptococcus pneumoniae]|nr:hypothetical protein [Streptococcus pneumoniae]
MQNLKKYLLLDSGLVVGYTLENAQLKLNKLKKDTENPNHSYLSQLDVTYKTPDLMSHFLPP